MHRRAALLLAVSLLAVGLIGGQPSLAVADGPAPLFINLTTDDPHRASMAIAFGKNQLERGHPLTLFLNDRGVYVGARGQAERFASHQEQLAALIGKGAVVIVCPMCMRHYGVAEADLIDGAKVGNPELTGDALFAPDTRSMTW